MDITSIVLSKSVDGTFSNVATFSLDNTSPTDSYILRAVSGLDAEEISPRLYGQGSLGTRWVSMRLQPRNIVLRIILNPNYAAGQTPGFLRDALYKVISSYRTSMINLGFLNGATEVAQISGYVTKFESGLASATPEVQITITCPYPYFRSRTRVVANMTGVDKLLPVITDNVSTAPHGFRFVVTLTATQLGMTIRRADNDWAFRVNFLFNTGDVLTISSEEDNKYVTVVRSGSTLNVANQIVLGSQWPILFPGTNNFTVNISTYNFSSVDWYTTNWGI